MKKLVISFVLLSLLFSASSLNAQTDWMEEYWRNTDFNDTALVSNEQFSEHLLNFLYRFTNAEEHTFDSLTINGLGFVLGKAKANMRAYEYVLAFALNGYTGMGRSTVTDYLLNYLMV